MAAQSGGLISLVVTVFILILLDIYAFWPILIAVGGFLAVPGMLLIILLEGVGVWAELNALG